MFNPYEKWGGIFFSHAEGRGGHEKFRVNCYAVLEVLAIL